MPRGNFYQDFIKEIQKEYAPFTRMNGQRFTGYGVDGELQPDQPAGVVHEGEQVIEAGMVEEAGGPRRIREQVERLAQENQQLPAMEEPVQEGPRLRGYQAGTGEGTVGDLPPGFELGPTGSPQLRVPKASDPVPVTDTQLNLGGTPDITLDAPPPKLPDPDTTTDKPDTESGLDRSFQRIEGLAEGRSEAARIAGERTTQELTAKHAAERQSMNQRMAQEGASPEEINTAMAQLSRDQRSESEQTRTGLALGEAERAERAAVTSAQLGLSKEQFFETHKLDLRKVGIDEKHIQFVDDLALKQYGENVRQFGEIMALDLLKTSIQESQFAEMREIDWANIDLATEAGQLAREQFETYADLAWSKFGLTERQQDFFEDRTIKEFQENVRRYGIDDAFRMLQRDDQVEQFKHMLEIDWANVDISQQVADDARDKVDKYLELDWAKYDLSSAELKDAQARAWTVIDQNAEQFGLMYALDQVKVNAEIQTPLMNAAIAAGDYNTASDIASTMGMPIDFTKVEKAEQRAEIGQHLANLMDDIPLVDEKGDPITMEGVLANEMVQEDLEGMWAILNPDEDASGDKYDTWAKGMIKNHQLSQDPFYTAVLGMFPATIQGIANSMGWDKSMSFNGMTGDDGLKFAITSMLASQAMMVDEDGNWTMDPKGFTENLVDGNAEAGINIDTGTVTLKSSGESTTTIPQEDEIVMEPRAAAKSDTLYNVPEEEPTTVTGTQVPRLGDISTEGMEGLPKTQSKKSRDAGLLWIDENLEKLDIPDEFGFQNNVMELMDMTNSLAKRDADRAEKTGESGDPFFTHNIGKSSADAQGELVAAKIREVFGDVNTSGIRDHIYWVHDQGKINRTGTTMLMWARMMDAGFNEQQAYYATAQLVGQDSLDAAIKAAGGDPKFYTGSIQ